MLANSFQAYFDRSGRVEAIEVMGPARDGQIEGVEPTFAALYREVDVFRTPASKLAEVVCRDAEPDSAARDYAVAFEFPSIGLSLWREASKDTPFFETVAVSRSNRS